MNNGGVPAVVMDSIDEECALYDRAMRDYAVAFAREPDNPDVRVRAETSVAVSTAINATCQRIRELIVKHWPLDY